MIDAFVSGYVCGSSKKENKNESLQMTFRIIEQINIQLQDELISFEEKLSVYTACVNQDEDVTILI